MINYKVTLTAKADRDYDDIYKYIQKEFGEVYADKLLMNTLQASNQQFLIYVKLLLSG